jgi:hypothetical protein
MRAPRATSKPRRAANIKLQNHQPLFPAGNYLLGAAGWAQGGQELACAEWIVGIQALTNSAGCLSYYGELNSGSIRLAVKYCLTLATESRPTA